MGCVYLITSPSGKQYVGKTVAAFETRWEQHCRDARNGSRFAIHCAIRKYGRNSFKHKILHVGVDDPEQLSSLEIAEIANHGTLAPKGYNMTEGGEGFQLCPEVERKRAAGIKASWERVEIREKRILGQKEANARPAVMARRSEIAREVSARPEVREKRSKGIKAAYDRPGARERRSETAKEVMQRPDVKEKLLIKLAEYNLRPEVRERRSIIAKEINSRPEVKARKSASMKETLAAPGVRERMSERAKVAMARPEVRARKSASTKANWADPDYRQKVSLGLRRSYDQAGANDLRRASIKRSKCAKTPNYFCDGVVFSSMPDAATALGTSSIDHRVKSQAARWRWWHTIPNHNDPECDAVEECWAIMQWAEANPDHENVPAWVRRRA